MTEPTLNEAVTERVELMQREHDLHKMARDAFEREWARAASEARLDPSLVTYDGSPAHLSAELTDFISVRNSEVDGLEYWRYSDDNGYEQISQDEAARAAGIDIPDLEDAAITISTAFHAARDFWDDARSVRQAADHLAVEAASPGRQEVVAEPVDDVLAAVARARLGVRRGIADFSDVRPDVADSLRRADRALSSAVESLRPERDEGLDVGEWTVSPERAQGVWIETTTQLRTLIDTEQYTAVRNSIRETNSYLLDYVSGETQPGLVEEEDLYLDALNRATVPLPSAMPEQVLAEIRNRGELVPDFPDPAEVAEATGVRGLHVSELQRALTRPGKSPTPRTHESVLFAGAWRAATKHLDEGLVVSYDVPDAPGQALVERLDGNLDSYVSAIRTGRNEIILNDATGTEIDRTEVGGRLGLDEDGVAAVMTGLTDGLEAAEMMSQSPADNSGPAAESAPAHVARAGSQASRGLADPLTSAHLPPHNPGSTNPPSRS